MAKDLLAGIRVADFSHWWAGPSGTTILGALGADVIKIESVQHMDTLRGAWSLTYGSDPNWFEQGPAYNLTGTNKRGITLNVNSPRGRELCLDLIKKSDVVVENFSPRVMANFGMSYPQLKELNPRLIMVSQSGYGQVGPWRDFVGFGTTFEMVSGAAALTGYDPEDVPRIIAGASDPIAGVTAVYAILAALRERDRTGEGQYIDMSETESLAVFCGKEIIQYQLTGKIPPRIGNRHPVYAPHNAYQCTGDHEWVAIAVTSDEEWAGLTRAMHRPEWVADSRFSTILARKHNEREIDDAISQWTSGQDKWRVMEQLRAQGVPSGAALQPAEVNKDPQLKAWGMFKNLKREFLGEIPFSQFPIHFSDATCEQRFAAPTLGQHNEEVLGGLLGVTAEEMQQLRQDNVIGTRPLGS